LRPAAEHSRREPPGATVPALHWDARQLHSAPHTMGCGASSSKAPPARQAEAAAARLGGDAKLEPIVNTEKVNGKASKRSTLDRQRSIERLQNEAATTAGKVKRRSSADPESPAIELPADDNAGSSSEGSSDSLTKLANMNLERLKEEFEKCDTSGNRRLTVDELSNLLVKLFGEEVLTAVDADGKGVVPSLLAALDTDGSGDVDLDELEAAWRAWFGQALNPKRCLLIIDVQNDFIDGTLGLKGCPAGQVRAPLAAAARRRRGAGATCPCSCSWLPGYLATCLPGYLATYPCLLH
jgi:hypothetical protein